MSKDPAILFYPKDFIEGTQLMSWEERGQYIYLLCIQHQSGHLSKENMLFITKSKKVLSKFVLANDGKYHNLRMHEEKIKRLQHSQHQRENALKGWEKRKKQQMPPHQFGIAVAMPLGNGNGNANADVNTNTDSLNLNPSWKNSFDVYQTEETSGFESVLTDEKFLREQEKFYPNLDLKLTLEKAHKNFWNTEAGWKNKKKFRSKEIDWKATYRNALSQKQNHVYKQKIFKSFAQQNDEEFQRISNSIPVFEGDPL